MATKRAYWVKLEILGGEQTYNNKYNQISVRWYLENGHCNGQCLNSVAVKAWKGERYLQIWLAKTVCIALYGLALLSICCFSWLVKEADTSERS